MHPCAWNAVNQEWCKAVHNPACQRFSQKRLSRGKENISGCLHVLMCRYNLYPAVVDCIGKKAALVLLIPPEPTALLEWVFCGRLCGSWKCRMWEINNVQNILLENLWAGSVVWQTRQAVRVLGRFALWEIEIWAVLDRTEFGVQTEAMRLYCVTSEKWHNVQVHPRARQEGQQRKKRYSCTLKPGC
jgi:hypothetical protein